MDIKELKHMLKHSTAVLILDNGEPSFVVLDYTTYKQMLNQPAEVIFDNASDAPAKGPTATDLELMERINKDISALKAQIEEEEKQLGID